MLYCLESNPVIFLNAFIQKYFNQKVSYIKNFLSNLIEKNYFKLNIR